jgi:hypothetical protein
MTLRGLVVKQIVIIAAMIATTPAWGCNPATHSAMRDQARAAEKQAESLQCLERIKRDRLRMQERAQRNASR